ncbi:MAG TPA: hypothetical protein PKL53_09215 [Methylotenera sp.]|nr:hypothetical protein [Methylotenera sp.]HPV44482.1 hypothetical protein [Methylotenera sp.]
MITHSLKLLIKSSQLPVREYVRNLEAENTKLQKQIAKLECNNISQKHEVSALKQKLNAYLKKGHVTVVLNKFDANL